MPVLAKLMSARLAGCSQEALLHRAAGILEAIIKHLEQHGRQPQSKTQWTQVRWAWKNPAEATQCVVKAETSPPRALEQSRYTHPQCAVGAAPAAT